MKYRIGLYTLILSLCASAVFCSVYYLPAFKTGEGNKGQTALPGETALSENPMITSMLAEAGLEKEDVDNLIEDARAINSDKAPRLAETFRPGHVSPGSLNDYLIKTDDGFNIDLKNSTQVPTPTIYKGKIYVSGGFGSKIFHCFDAKSGNRIWSINLDDDGPSSAVVQDDIIVFNTESCTIFACNATSGEMLWSYWLGDPLMSMPTIANGKVFTAYPANYGSSNQYLNDGPNGGNYDLDGLNNVQQEEDVIQPENIEVPEDKKEAIKSRLIPTHGLICIDLKSGKIDWQKWIDGDVMSAPVAHGDELFVVTFPGTFYKFKQADGEILAASGARATSAPVILGEDVMFTKRADGDGEVTSEALAFSSTKSIDNISITHKRKAAYLDKNTQDKSDLKGIAANQDAGNGFGGGAPSSSGWQAAADNVGYSNVSSLQSYQGSRVMPYKGYNFSLQGDSMMCVSQKTNEPVWGIKLETDISKTGGFAGTPPLAIDNKLIVGTLEGDIIIYNAIDGKEIKRWKTGLPIRQQPVVEDGWIYAGTTQGKIVAINTGDKDLTGWPVWGGDAAHSGISHE